jgi:hypothetical protein
LTLFALFDTLFLQGESIDAQAKGKHMRIHIVRNGIGATSFVSLTDAEMERDRQAMHMNKHWLPGDPTPTIFIESIYLYGVGEYRWIEDLESE